MLNFDSNPALFPGKNSPNLAKIYLIFPGKERGDKALILTYLDSPMAEVFPDYCLLFSISAIFRGKRRVKVESKVLTLAHFSILQKFFEQCFCLLEYYLW